MRHPLRIRRSALLFLYKEVLDIDVGNGINTCRAKKPERLPSVLTVDETLKVLNTMTDSYQIMAKLLYGCGLRAIECLRLRVTDVDFGLNQIVVCSGKGQKDRIHQTGHLSHVPAQFCHAPFAGGV